MTENFAEIYELIEASTGIAVERGGRYEIIRRFIEKRASALGLDSPSDMWRRLTAGDKSELHRLIEVAVVVHSWFFRDPEQMGVLREEIGRRPERKELRVWVPGCARGEDVYSIAMMAAEVGRPLQILGTDINREALAEAQRARYQLGSLRAMPDAYRPLFRRTKDGLFELGESIRRSASFEYHNLVELPLPSASSGGWDIIVCRNVLIYFRPERVRQIVAQFAAALAPGGVLVLGAGEVTTLLGGALPGGLAVRRVQGRVLLAKADPSAASPIDAGACLTGGGGKPVAEAASHALLLGTSWVPLDAEVVPQLPILSTSGLQVAPAGCPEPAFAQLNATVSAEMPEDMRAAIELVSQGNVLLQNEDHDSALAHYLEAVERDPLCAEARLFSGVACYLCGSCMAALEHLRAALLLDPTLWPASFYLAMSLDGLGRANEARRHYQLLLEEHTHSLTICSNGSFVEQLQAWRHDVVAFARARLTAAGE